jgi:hypothetical protein
MIKIAANGQFATSEGATRPSLCEPPPERQAATTLEAILASSSTDKF